MDHLNLRSIFPAALLRGLPCREGIGNRRFLIINTSLQDTSQLAARSFIKEKYDALKSYLDEHAECLGEDNKNCYYCILPDKLFKLVDNVSQKMAKASLKLNRIGEGSLFPEIEFSFAPDQFEASHRLFNALGLPGKVMHGYQERMNYRYRNCDIALKHSDAWGYHLEIEQVIENKEGHTQAESRIREVPTSLG